MVNSVIIVQVADWSGWVRKTSPPPGFVPRTVQPVACLYIDYAIPTCSRLLISVYEGLHKAEFLRYLRNDAPSLNPRFKVQCRTCWQSEPQCWQYASCILSNHRYQTAPNKI